MDDLFDDLSHVPDLVVPITPMGIIGHILLLALGTAAVALGSLVATRSGSLVFAGVVGGLGVYVMLIAEHRFLRAVSPHSTVANIVLWIVFIGLAIAGGVVLARQIEDVGAGLLFVAGAGAAALVARFFDGIHETMNGVPMSWGLVLVLVIIGGAIAVDATR